MADRPDIVEALRRGDARNRDQMDLFARRRLEQRIADELADRPFVLRWFPQLAFVAGAALVLLVVAWNNRAPAPAPLPGVAVAETEDFQVHDPACRTRSDSGALELGGGCVVRMHGLDADIHTWSGARLQREDEELRILEGEVLLNVAPVRTGPPVRVHVSHGTIEVLGTRFRVLQDGGGGSVELLEGSIRFVDEQGRVSMLVPGDRHDWGASALSSTPTADADAAEEDIEIEEDPVARPDTSVRKRVRPPVAPAREIIAQVARLRASGDYQGAANRLSRALRERRSRRTKAVLSYELGTILARHVGDPEAACQHWRRHLDRYGPGRHGRAIERSVGRLGCVTP